MRILVAPDKFAGTLSAVEAANAMAEGWSRTAPESDIVTVPMADGGPGFVDVLHASLGGDLLAVTVRGPLGDPVPATVLKVEETAYIESAQACGLALLPTEDDGRTPSPGAATQCSWSAWYPAAIACVVELKREVACRTDFSNASCATVAWTLRLNSAASSTSRRASAATSWPSVVTTSGFTSTNIASARR
jgi:hypothetical protein